MDTVLELKNVSKSIGKRKIVDNISLRIRRGEIFGFLGPNGAGKTTTIKMITGLISIDEGEIIVNKKNVRTNFEKAMESIGGIIENPEMYAYLTGRENLQIFAAIHGNISKARIQEVVRLVKLENRIDDKVKRYSLGMRQRLGVAQALLHNPKLLILDEPTNGLDPMGIKELRDNLRDLAQKEGLSVLVSSHLLSEMELMCDRFGIIDSGKIIDIKTLYDIKSSNNQSNNYFVDVSDIVKSKKLIEGYKEYISVEVLNNKLKIESSREDIAIINKRLIENNILVYEISYESSSLEEEFMKITKGSKGQIQ